MTAPEHVAMVRMVIGAADKFPALARAFYEAGPAHGAALLAAYLEAQSAPRPARHPPIRRSPPGSSSACAAIR